MSELKLHAAEYWEWRTTISEMDVAKEKAKLADAELKILYRDTEIASLRAKLHQSAVVSKARTALENAQAEYARFKGVLEGRLGVSLNNKVIDDITFEVKDLPEANNNQEGEK